MNLEEVQHQLAKTRRSAIDLLQDTRTLFEHEISNKYVMPHTQFLTLSESRAADGNAWIPSYPPFAKSENVIVSLGTESGSLNDVKQFWNRTANEYEDKVFRGNSPLKLLRSKPDLGTTTTVAVASSNDPLDIDGEPIGPLMTHKLPPSPSKPPLAAGRPLLVATPNKWRDHLKSPPPQNAPGLTPGRPPLHPGGADNGATIPILPSNANALWPPRSPQDEYLTPKPAALEQPPVPPSSFVPRYTPAPGPVEIITEALVPLPDSPRAEDQYEITEWEDSADEMDDDSKERRRMAKKIPSWCIGWIETAKTQTNIDPDTVLGTRLPKCDLEVLFGKTNNAYLNARKGRRGSSGEWGMDDVTRRELEEYRAIMGHTQQLESVVIIKTIDALN
jgi:hypothetical protein